jgi:LPXTG-motif cell wall-anchored protein
MRVARRVLAPLVLACLTVAPGVAQGQGVVIDPDSPTGKEYAIPAEQARREGSQGSRTMPSQGTEQIAPLFGQGVTPDASGSSARADAQRRGTSSAARDQASGSGDSPKTTRNYASPPAVGETLATRHSGESGSMSGLALGAGGVAVALVGGAAGLLLRRRRLN